ncbi:MAG: efflux RND transporter periplasmic adaptor subunit [Acidobacteriota bacterium]|nr:MAG: efflux RND transporter periplasmic adaptor subunit [Acidobacteriota bacterium]
MKEDLSALKIEKHRKGNGGGGKGFWVGLCAVLFLVVIALVFYIVQSSHGLLGEPVSVEQTASADPLPVKPEPIRLSREVLIASGYIIAHHSHELGSKVTGRVEWIGVEKGDKVTKGQLLVKLEDREFRAQLAQSEATLALTKSRLEELEAGTRPQEVDRAEAELKRAEADLSNARLEHERLEGLLRQGVVPEQQVDDARSRVKMTEASVRSARRSFELLDLGPRQEQIEQARAEVSRAEGAVEYSQVMLDATEIRAPISGTVLRRIAEIGEMITTSFAGTSGAKSAVVALADLKDLQVELDISQSDFNRISSEQECQMTPEAYPDRIYPCEIDEISPEANRQKASIQVKVKVLEPDDYLRPEMSARVTFLRKEEQSDE